MNGECRYSPNEIIATGDLENVILISNQSKCMAHDEANDNCYYYEEEEKNNRFVVVVAKLHFCHFIKIVLC